ncbi:uncharacterized protein KY384_006091 [Bacidia gigantensis]|uniref:uncharacterized protein n=1 Tax=Bacidia gigantensis TaxID=2732470 RepID=UPI001D050DD5|nr:uncharacterized protein KY384_006091 [Bacidia gigantensis]KAG8529454.1 hypothetical protein KY384_006091 [Bacidia gigantensis]
MTIVLSGYFKRSHHWSKINGLSSQARPLSTNSAINRSLRKTQFAASGPPSDSCQPNGYKRRSPFPAEQRSRRRPQTQYGKWDQTESIQSIPYTTPASVFLYGTSVVKAALQARRRKFYKLYIYEGSNRESQENETIIRRQARDQRVLIKGLKNDEVKLMDRLSHGRPHNARPAHSISLVDYLLLHILTSSQGYILEASPIPQQPINALAPVNALQGDLAVVLDHQSQEEKAINGVNSVIQHTKTFPRYPFVAFLDGILDSGNLGAIVRSAFFLGVDAVIISHHHADISTVALKASAGTFEFLPSMTVAHPIAFLNACKSNGWKVYAANAPSGLKKTPARILTPSTLGKPLLNHPCILVLGSEGEGLPFRIRKTADFELGIEGSRARQFDVDSLNVSVAAALLFESFLRKPDAAQFEATADTSIQNHKKRLF